MLSGEALELAYRNFIDTHSKNLGLEQKSIDNKRQALGELCEVLQGLEFNVDTANAYKEWKWENGWTTPNSKNNVRKYVKAFVNYLHDEGLIQRNFAKLISTSKDRIEHEPIPTAQQTQDVIDAAFDDSGEVNAHHLERRKLNKFACEFMVRTGIRPFELEAIRGKDLHIDELNPQASKVYLVNAKGGVPQWQPLPKDMLAQLQLHVNDPLVFPVSWKRLNEGLRRGAAAVGLPEKYRMHAKLLRKVYCMDLAHKLPMPIVSALMRHSDISVTREFYMHYGISELGRDMNLNHSLIAPHLPQEQVIRDYLQKANRQFENNGSVDIAERHNPKKRTFTIEISY